MIHELIHKLKFLKIRVQLMEIRVKNKIGKRYFCNFAASNWKPVEWLYKTLIIKQLGGGGSLLSKLLYIHYPRQGYRALSWIFLFVALRHCEERNNPEKQVPWIASLRSQRREAGLQIPPTPLRRGTPTGRRFFAGSSSLCTSPSWGGARRAGE